MLQEAVTNAAKHCPKGTVVEVGLAFVEERAKLTIRDRGPGFTLPSDPATLSRAGHYGLANMRERAKKVSGDFRMTSAPGKGTCIELGVHAGEELER